MSICACGCGGETRGGTFLRGHDQTLRTNLEGKVRGLLRLSDIVEAVCDYADDLITCDDLCRRVKSIIHQK